MRRLSAVAGDTLVALRQNPLRSILSVLGLVIGVASLVGILALADGMELYARDQIGTTTDLQNISITPRATEVVDGVPIARSSVAVPTIEDAELLAAHLGDGARVALVQRRAAEVVLDTVRTAAALIAASDGIWSLGKLELEAGSRFAGPSTDGGATTSEGETPRVVLSASLAERLGESAESLVGRAITAGGEVAEVSGVLSAEAGRPAEVYGAYELFSEGTDQRPPSFVVRVERAEEVVAEVERIKAWLNRRYAQGESAFVVSTNEMRTRQVAQGMLLFKLVLGLITGISVVVGGVGVMNVLLVTVTERTREIGIRKAVGARRRDIRLQFLAEAMAVAGVGSVLGLLVGIAGVLTAVPLVRHFTEVPFQAVVTLQTLMVVVVVAVAVGLLFGTYPAVRAARLDPVDAMRRE